MRYVLVPIEIEEQCSLGSAVAWIQYRLYPVDETSFRFTIADALSQFPEHRIDDYYSDEPATVENREEAQDRLFAKIKESTIRARGRLSSERADAGSAAAKEWTEWKWKIPSSHERTEIPVDFWRSKGVAWSQGSAKSPVGEFTDILVDTAGLFRAFPEGRTSPVTVQKGGPLFFWEDGSTRAGVGGRPPKWDWERFLVEVAVIANGINGLPDQQAELEKLMQGWFIDEYGDAPAESLIRSHVAPIYAALKQRKSSQ